MKNLIYLTVMIWGGQYMSSQTWQWGKRGGADFTEAFTGNNEEIRSIETDANGNVYILSPVTGANFDIEGNIEASYGNDDAMIASLTCDGTYRWGTAIGAANLDYVISMKLDQDGDVYVVGKISYGTASSTPFHFDENTLIPYSTENQKTIFLAKYDGDTGLLLWQRLPQPDGQTAVEYLTSNINELMVDPDGTSYMLCRLIPGSYANGAFQNVAPGVNTFLLKYDTNGNFIEAISIDMFAQNSVAQRKLFTMKKSSFNGNFYVAGYANNAGQFTFGGQPTGQTYLASYSNTGQFLWLKTDTFTSAGNRKIRDMFIDTNGDIYLTGHAKGGDTFAGYTVTTTSTSPPTLYRLDASGNLIWGSNATQSGAAQIASNSVIVDGNEVIITMGLPNLTWDNIVVPFVMNGGFNAGILRFNKATGDGISYTELTSTFGANEYGTYITEDIHGNYYVGGSFDSNITINGTTLLNNGSSTDFFLAKYGTADCTLGVDDHSEIENIQLAPNPANDRISINISESTNYIIYNTIGANVLQGIITASDNQINLSNLPSGPYFIKLETNSDSTRTMKFIKK